MDSMKINKEEIQKLIQETNQKIIMHTDVIYAFDIISEKVTNISQGSGILVIYNDRIYLLSVAHVHCNKSIIISGAYKKDTPKIEAKNEMKIQPLNIVYSCDVEDYSIFENYPCSVLTRKVPFDLSLSFGVTKELILKHVGCLSCSLGYLGKLTEFYSDSEDKIDVCVELVSNAGPITYVDDDKIVADFTAMEIEAYTSKAEEFVKDNKDKKKIPLFGCSGCGLWILDENHQIILIGLMKGEADKNQEKHNVEFVPIWKIINCLQNIYPIRY